MKVQPHRYQNMEMGFVGFAGRVTTQPGTHLEHNGRGEYCTHLETEPESLSAVLILFFYPLCPRNRPEGKGSQQDEGEGPVGSVRLKSSRNGVGVGMQRAA